MNELSDNNVHVIHIHEWVQKYESKWKWK